MLRIVDGMVFEGKPSPDRFRVKVHDLGHGHREVSITRCIDWEQSAYLDPCSINAQVLRGERDDPLEAEKREANERRAQRRAASEVRKRCKAAGFDTLLTLTYKANQTDPELAKRHFDLFAKRMRRALGEWAYCAAFEQQKRGAWHIHIATHALPVVMRASNGVRVKSFVVIRAMWRAVVGDLGGNIDQSRRSRFSRSSPGKLAAYLAKYMTKAHAVMIGMRRFQASQILVPEAVAIEVRGTCMADLVALVVPDVFEGGRSLVSSFTSRFGDTVFLASELANDG